MNHDTPETWKDRKRNELIREQMEMAYEIARISIQIKELRHEPAVPEGSIPLSMIEPLINETVERLVRLSKLHEPKRVTCARILDAVGCPDLVLERIIHRDALSGVGTIGYRFSYLKQTQYGDVEVLGQLDVDHPRLKDLTLEQWVENGRKLIEQVELRIDLSDVIATVSPDRTPFQR
mgnify:CR=1 FL=1|tara:strand:+ start:93 stop:626 length:534 start_codon:yes stop_codon:yes gene_type:complete